MQELDKTPAHLHLSFSQEFYSILRFPSHFKVPTCIFTSAEYCFVSVTKTPNEVSCILATAGKPTADAFPELLHPEMQFEGPWTAVKVQGPMDLCRLVLPKAELSTDVLALTGILNELTTPLRQAAVPIFAMSTWDTDYVLIPTAKAAEAAKVLSSAGWVIKK